MGIYRDFKSNKDPMKFLERFSKNIPSENILSDEKEKQIPEDEKNYEVPLSRTAMDYVTLKKKCQELLLDMIDHSMFTSILADEKEKLKKFSKGFDNFNFKSKGLSWERELQIKNLFLKSVKEYNEGLKSLGDYINTKKTSLVNSGINLISSGGERLLFIKKLAEEDKYQIIEEMKKYLKEGKSDVEHAPSEVNKISDDKPAKIISEEKTIDIKDLSLFPLFKGLNSSEIGEIKNYMSLNIFNKDDMLHSEGMDCNKLFVIISGDVSLYKSIAGTDRIKILDELSTGDISGDIGIMDGGPCATNGKVISEKAELYSITREDFLSIIKSYVQISFNLNRIYSDRLRKTLEKF